MSRIAVDVVLLPDEEMTGWAIKANAELIRKAGREIVLNKDDCLPHISLAMGCIEQKDVEATAQILGKIAEECGSGVAKLNIIGVHIATNSVGEKVSAFIIEKTKELQLLHESIMQALRSYFDYDVSADMIYGSGEVAHSTLLWIRDYTDKSSFANFSPHITIGYGQANPIESPIEFTTRQLALCHLGNHCTCRQILASAKLEGE